MLHRCHLWTTLTQLITEIVMVPIKHFFKKSQAIVYLVPITPLYV